jgi:eukaryotic-like serine/threonine-protein kinase
LCCYVSSEMGSLLLDAVDAPREIVASLKELSSHIVFLKACPKGANGYLFFGKNVVTGIKVAVKYYYWGGDRTYHAEPRTLAQIDSPNVVQVLDAALIDKDYAYFITPYYTNGDLDDYLSNGTRGNLSSLRLVSDILNGLTHLHGRNLLHRDLKPQNIFRSDSDSALIGDFGSLKRVPDGQSSVPGSGHSLLYRPPESVQNGVYSYQGDIYQVGIVLYQLLGGHLPYEETAWLNSRQRRDYSDIPDPIDRTLYVDRILKEKIVRGQLIDLGALPPWVCQTLRRLISKACHKNPNKRFDTASAFRAKIHQMLTSVGDWNVVGEHLVLNLSDLSYRLCPTRGGDLYTVEKKKTGKWRKDNSYGAARLANLVDEIERATRN